MSPFSDINNSSIDRNYLTFGRAVIPSFPLRSALFEKKRSYFQVNMTSLNLGWWFGTSKMDLTPSAPPPPLPPPPPQLPLLHSTSPPWQFLYCPYKAVVRLLFYFIFVFVAVFLIVVVVIGLCLALCITKTCLFIYAENFTTKNEKKKIR